MHTGTVLSGAPGAWDDVVNVSSACFFPTLHQDTHLEFLPEVSLTDFPSKGGDYYNEDVAPEEKWMYLPVLVPVVTVKINN